MRRTTCSGASFPSTSCSASPACTLQAPYLAHPWGSIEGRILALLGILITIPRWSLLLDSLHPIACPLHPDFKFAPAIMIVVCAQCGPHQSWPTDYAISSLPTVPSSHSSSRIP
jgi:hypothetical protein